MVRIVQLGHTLYRQEPTKEELAQAELERQRHADRAAASAAAQAAAFPEPEVEAPPPPPIAHERWSPVAARSVPRPRRSPAPGIAPSSALWPTGSSISQTCSTRWSTR